MQGYLGGEIMGRNSYPIKQIEYPNWKDQTAKLIHKKVFPASHRQKALDILDHPRTEEALKHLIAANDGEYPDDFWKIVSYCARISLNDIPSLFKNKKKQIDLEAAALNLLRKIREAVGSDLHETNYIWQYVLQKKYLPLHSRKPTPEEMSDKDILNALTILADFLKILAIKPKKSGHPVNLKKQSLLLVLNDIFRDKYRQPVYPAIGALMSATFGGNWGTEVVKKTLARKKRHYFPGFFPDYFPK